MMPKLHGSLNPPQWWKLYADKWQLLVGTLSFRVQDSDRLYKYYIFIVPLCIMFPAALPLHEITMYCSSVPCLPHYIESCSLIFFPLQHIIVALFPHALYSQRHHLCRIWPCIVPPYHVPHIVLNNAPLNGSPWAMPHALFFSAIFPTSWSLVLFTMHRVPQIRFLVLCVLCYLALFPGMMFPSVVSNAPYFIMSHCVMFYHLVHRCFLFPCSMFPCAASVPKSDIMFLALCSFFLTCSFGPCWFLYAAWHILVGGPFWLLGLDCVDVGKSLNK